MDKHLNNMFKSCVKLGIINIVTIFYSSIQSERTVDIYSFKLLDSPHCPSTETVLHGCVNASFQISADYFGDKMRNLFRCPLRVSTFHYPPVVVFQNSYPETADIS